MSPTRTALPSLLTTVLALSIALFGTSRAESRKPAIPHDGQPIASACTFTGTVYDWDFSVGPQGFGATNCDAGGAQVWQYGATSYVPGAPGQVWGTILNDQYPNDSGAGLTSPAFWVSPASNLVEVVHYFDTEWGYDGCNLVVRPAGAVVPPVGGYSISAISASTAYYAWCVDGEPGWTGSSAGWRVDCFDLSAYMDQEVNLQFDFGSDASVTFAGWYISRVRVGGNAPPIGACCFYATGNCSLLSAADCAAAGGTYWGDNTFCPDTPCLEPTGACCFSDHSCIEMIAVACAAEGGTYQGDNIGCTPNPCGSPVPPQNVIAETLGPDQVRLSWSAVSSGDALYVDRKRGPGGAWENVQMLPVNATEWIDPDVMPGESYYYRVRTVAGEEVSLYSNFTITVVGIVPWAPSNVVAVAASPVRINITWVDTSTFEAGFEVEGKKGEMGPWTVMKPDPPANSNSTWIGTLTPAWDYRFRVRAYNAFGHSAWVESNACTTPLDPGNFNALIRVRRGTQVAPGASVFVDHGAGFDSVGVTDANGECSVSGLRLNDRIRAFWRAQNWVTCRDYAKFSSTCDMGMRLTLDSDVMQTDGSYQVFRIQTTESMYVLELVHPIFRFDLGISTEWNIPTGDPYWNQLLIGCQKASDYLYNVSDGQMALGKIAVWDAQEFWGEVDVRIENSVWPHSAIDELLECDCCSPEEHCYLSRKDDGLLPDQEQWARTMIHELGHYVFGLYDEYITAIGGIEQMDSLKVQRPDIYPQNYGFMMQQVTTTEMSSANDYTKGLVYPTSLWNNAMTETKQLWEHDRTCWDYVEQKYEARSSYVDIKKPVYGWFESGHSTSPDRDGPLDNVGITWWGIGDSSPLVGPDIHYQMYDRGGNSFSRDAEVLDGERPVPDARVYKLSAGRLTYMGETDKTGRLEVVGLHEGDAVRSYARTEMGNVLVEASPTAVIPGSDPLTFRSSEGNRAGSKAPMLRDDLTPPGAAVEVTPTGLADALTLSLDLWADETLAGNPVVVAFYASRIDTLPVGAAPGPDHFRALLQVSLADSTFDGNGLFEVTMTDAAANRSVFTVPFVVETATAGEPQLTERGPGSMNLFSPNVPHDQVASGASSNAAPFRVPGFAPVPTGDIYSFHMTLDDQYQAPAAINIAYDDSLLAGCDERSLRIFRWDSGVRQWTPIDGSAVSTGSNVVSALVYAGGVFCVFAEQMVSDPIPPASVQDLGAVGTAGLGAIQLLWTATGDDGSQGAAQDYIVAYGDAPITQATWAELPKIDIPGGDLAAGSSAIYSANLPLSGHLYYLALRAKDKASNLSPLSNGTYTISGVADPNLLPAPPTNVRAVDLPGDNGGSVRLTWTKSHDDGGGKGTVTAYHIYRDAPPASVPESLATVPAGTAALVDAAAPSGVEYTYWLSAADGSTETFSSPNFAFSARNTGVPVGDFTSDTVVGVDDLCLLAGAYGIDSSNVEFEPLFDLDHNQSVSNEDFQAFQSAFGAGGVPATNPAGENAVASILSQVVSAGGTTWHLNLTLRGVSNLAGYSFKVTYPSQTLTFLQATADSAGVIPNILNRDGGVTPFFLLLQPEPQPGVLYMANAIERPSTTSASDGDGFLGQLTFAGSGMAEVSVSQIVLMDSRRLTNLFSAPTAVEDGATILRPQLLPCAPNPFRTRTFLRFQIPGRQKVTLSVFDVGGRRVRTLVDGLVEPGFHEVAWDGRTSRQRLLPAGVYFYRFDTQGYTKARKVVLLP